MTDKLRPRAESAALHAAIRAFRDFGRATEVLETVADVEEVGTVRVPTYVNEFWTSKQRAAHSLHEISYRACFKPQLPRFFLDRLTAPGDVVYDPFMGRGTTLIEAALRRRVPIGCDVNPLSRVLVEPRLRPPTIEEVAERLASIDFSKPADGPDDLLVFYHPETLRELCVLRRYLREREASGGLDPVDAWIRMVAVNRLTGHSPGFFSVYTMPPNQAVSVASQRRINARRNQVPPRRDVPALILRKSRSLLRDVDPETRDVLAEVAPRAILLTADAAKTPTLPADSVDLVVTSPPFLDVVDYAQDNWLRCWFCGIDPESVPISIHRRLEDWQATMTAVFRELARVVRPEGWIAFEVGEVRHGTTKLEEAVLPCGVRAGLLPELVLINDQEFTKTSNCWGVENRRKGTNTNRIVLFRRTS